MATKIEHLVLTLGSLLQKKKWSLVTAESCTGGGLAYYITGVPGTSSWFERGFITYSNESKRELLGVKNSTLDTHGAVSEQTAHEMAIGALKASRAQLSISITGLAGPSCGSENKPLGTVWFGLSGTEIKTSTYLEMFNGNRGDIREQSIVVALEKLIQVLDVH